MGIRYLDALPKSADLVVVGGGITGAATAFYASRAGLRPLIVEARPRLCTMATPVAAGAFRLQFDNLEELELVRESAELFTDFTDRTGQSVYDIDLQPRGYLWLTTDQGKAKTQRDLVSQLHGWGQTDVEIVTGDDVRGRWPWVSRDVVQARWRAGDGFIDTKQLTYGLAEGANADVFTSCAVTGFAITGGRLTGVGTDLGTIDCGSAVICAGQLSGAVAAGAGIELPIATIVRQKLILPQVSEVPHDAPMVIDEDTGSHWRPAYDSGAWLLFTDPSTPPSEPVAEARTDVAFAFKLLDPGSEVSVSRVVPFWREVWERGSAHWLLQAGMYTQTPDQRPLIGSSGIDGLFINTGYGGHGIMLGPAGSRLCVDAIVGSADGPGAFAPSRTMQEREQPTL
jgi:sarcosine oxidase, subunit beta